jgi:hypothetical protein
MRDEMEPFFSRPEVLHKKGNNEQCWQEYCLYINHRLAVTIAVELRLDSLNWQKYIFICKSVLIIDPRKTADKYNTTRKAGKQEI